MSEDPGKLFKKFSLLGIRALWQEFWYSKSPSKNFCCWPMGLLTEGLKGIPMDARGSFHRRSVKRRPCKGTKGLLMVSHWERGRETFLTKKSHRFFPQKVCKDLHILNPKSHLIKGKCFLLEAQRVFLQKNRKVFSQKALKFFWQKARESSPSRPETSFRRS